MQVIRSHGVWLCPVTAKVRWRDNLAKVPYGACRPTSNLCVQRCYTPHHIQHDHAELVTTNDFICLVSCWLSGVAAAAQAGRLLRWRASGRR
jgi:hypothetical protein